ncbi:MAG TPA: peptidoglycan-binding domain-containing protein [Gammaproteobacteria bacterium]|nr:peptidoglycan-binding domain-containing protein [Gammaproteobacteria bacterium]
MKKTLLAVAASGLALAGCGTTTADRTVSGAGIGAGAGAIVGAVTSLSVPEAAVLGAVAGGLTGALTKPDQVNLGRPAWSQSSNPPPASPTAQQGSSQYSNYAYAPVDSGTVRQIQSALKRLGLYDGQVDGVAGPRTQNAIRSYQQQNGLAVNGQPSTQLLEHLRQRGVAGTSA